jgi:hypothetical protein
VILKDQYKHKKELCSEEQKAALLGATAKHSVKCKEGNNGTVDYEGKMNGWKESVKNQEVDALKRAESFSCLCALYDNLDCKEQTLKNELKQFLETEMKGIIDGLMNTIKDPSWLDDESGKAGELLAKIYDNSTALDNIKNEVREGIQDLVREGFVVGASVRFGLQKDVFMKMVPKGEEVPALVVFEECRSTQENGVQKFAYVPLLKDEQDQRTSNFECTERRAGDIQFIRGEPKKETPTEVLTIFLLPNQALKDFDKQMLSLAQTDDASQKLAGFISLLESRDFDSAIRLGSSLNKLLDYFPKEKHEELGVGRTTGETVLRPGMQKKEIKKCITETALTIIKDNPSLSDDKQTIIIKAAKVITGKEITTLEDAKVALGKK